LRDIPGSDRATVSYSVLDRAYRSDLFHMPASRKATCCFDTPGAGDIVKGWIREKPSPKTMPPTETTAYWPFVAYFLAVVAITIGMLGLSAILGQRHRERATGEPYEGGIVSTGSARLRLSVRFYLVAILFVIFDLEVIFVFAWAIAVRELGWSGFLGVVVFIAIMLAALIYEWRMGALDWGKSRQVREREFQKRQERVQ
jgi:NADH-quinone oxidoreductase subunit A